MTSPRPSTSRGARAAALCLVAAVAVVVGPAAASATSATACPAWTKSPVARGYAVLENLGFDGQGGMILS